MSKSTQKLFSARFTTGFFVKLALVFICLTPVVRATYYYLTEGFCLNRIETPIHFNKDLSVPAPSSQTLKTLREITGQRFFYLKKGSQAYAFVSEDGLHVLKLFKYHHMQSADWILSIPVPRFITSYRDSLAQRRTYRINLTLQSYKIAAEKLLDECALVYAQILPTRSYTLPVTIVDAIGRTYTIDLASHGYAMQQCIRLVLPSFETWIKQNDMTEAKKAIDSLIDLIAQRSIKGIQDSDPDLHKNAGLIGTKATFIDIGSFFLNPNINSPEEMRKDMKKIFLHFSEWLSERSPELADYLQQQLSSKN
jgi:hypothetical protein